MLDESLQACSRVTANLWKSAREHVSFAREAEISQDKGIQLM